MKKLLMFFFSMLIFVSLHAVECECGEHRTGITTFNVEGEDCCEGQAGDFGLFITYYQDRNGVWVVDQKKVITGLSAQDDCCPDV